MKNPELALNDLPLPYESEDTELEEDEDEYVELQTSRIDAPEVTLLWRDLSYTVQLQDSSILRFIRSLIPRLDNAPTKTVFSGLSGYAEPGRFMGIIGCSGAGKTSLLNILANDATQGEIRGTVEANGESIRSSRPITKYKQLVGYVRQDDVLLPFLTVKETMFYAGMLILPRSMSFVEKLERINELISELGLRKCQDNFVSNQLAGGISGGEMKRLSVGVQLLRSPAILLLDEPTSGLDALSALQLCQNLGRLARRYNHTVIAVIHQPRAQIFRQFDDLLILAPGGKQIYFGHAKAAVGYFSAHGYQCPVLENPADYILDQTTIDLSNPAKRAASEERIKALANCWQGHPEPESITEGGFNSFKDTESGANMLWATFWLSVREMVNESRNQRYLRTRLFQCIVVPVLLGIFLLGFNDDQTGIAERTGVIFLALMSNSFNELMSALAVFIFQRAIFYRERAATPYPIISYWLAKQIALLPYQLFFPFLWIIIIYWMAGFQAEWYKFAIFFGTLESMGLFCSSLGLIAGVSLPPTISTIVGPIFVLIFATMAGFLVNLKNMSSFFYGLSFISYMRYAYECLVKNEFRGLHIDCTREQRLGGQCRFEEGEEYIDTLGFTDLDVFEYMLILLGASLFLRIVLYFVLRYSRPD